uniref:Ig-like domain-containing protein n=1 Tax=Strongyloides venezuelensis TaxID=75913 RepID=A0A0K0FDB9_STRVS
MMILLLSLSLFSDVSFPKVLSTSDQFNQIHFSYTHNFNSQKNCTKQNCDLTSKYLSQSPNLIDNIQFEKIKIFQFNVKSFNIIRNHFTLSTTTDLAIANAFLSQDPPDHTKKNLVKLKEFTCNLLKCDIGFIFYQHSAHVNSPSGMEIFKDDATSIKLVVYQKFVSTDGFLSFDTLEIENNYFPLVVCPYIHWNSIHTLTVFKPKEESGIIFNSFHNRHILVPLHPRHRDATRFICGKLHYYDNTNFDIGYAFKIRKSQNKLEIKKLNLLKDELSCDNGTSEDKYFHFIYNDKQSTMKYLDLQNLQNLNIFHDSTVYMYAKTDQRIQKLNSDVYFDVLKLKNKEDAFLAIKPTCARSVELLKASMKIYIKNGEEVKLLRNPKNPKIMTLHVGQKLINNTDGLECRVVVDGTDKKYLTNFYGNAFDTKLISIESNGDEKIIENLKFYKNSRGFGKYSCKLIPKKYGNLHDTISYIEDLTFEAVPSNKIETFREKYFQSTNLAMIHCQKTFSNFATFAEMNVALSPMSKYNYSIHHKTKLFMEESNYVKFKIREYVDAGKTFENINYFCTYKTGDGTKFVVKTKAIVIERNFLNSSSSDVDSVSSMIILWGVTALAVIIIVGVVAIAVGVKMMQRKKRKERKQKLKGLKSKTKSSTKSSSLTKSKSHSKSKPKLKVNKKTKISLPSQIPELSKSSSSNANSTSENIKILVF